MIYIFCALYCEAAEIINEYDLKRIDEAQKRALSIRFDVYKNNDIILTITGTGPVSPVVALTQICQEFYIKEDKNFLLNIGTAGGLFDGNNRCFLINKIHNNITNKDLYPDMFFDFGLKEGELCTDVTPTFKENMEKNKLYDMEGAFIFEAGKYYFSPGKMIFIKLLSDKGEVDAKSNDKIKISGDDIKKLVRDNLEEIKGVVSNLIYISKENIINRNKDDSFLANLENINHTSKGNIINRNKDDSFQANLENINHTSKENIVNRNIDDSFQANLENINQANKENINTSKSGQFSRKKDQYVVKISKSICASETMTYDIKKLVHYAMISNFDLDDLLLYLKKNEYIPVKSKKEGKQVFDIMKKKIIFYE